MSKTPEELKGSQSGYVVLDGNGATHSSPDTDSPNKNSLTPEIWSFPNSKTASPVKRGGGTPPEIVLPPPSSGSVSPPTPHEKLSVELKSVSDKVNSDVLSAIREKHVEELKMQREGIIREYEEILAKQHSLHVKNVQEAISKITLDLEGKRQGELSHQKKMYESHILQQESDLNAKLKAQEAKMQDEIQKRDADIKTEGNARLSTKAALDAEQAAHAATQALLAAEKKVHEGTQATLAAEQAAHAATRKLVSDQTETNRVLDYTQKALQYATSVIASHPIAVKDARDKGYTEGLAAGRLEGHAAGVAAEHTRMNSPAHM